MTDLLRYAAFTTDPSGGNPAGVVLDAGALRDDDMQRIAAQVGYSETAFLAGDEVRFFSPKAEVVFCGHATIALAVALAERKGVGPLSLQTRAGPVDVVTRSRNGRLAATLVSVPPRVERLSDDDLAALLDILHWTCEDLDESLPPRVAFAGVSHPVLAVHDRETLRRLDYDVPRLTSLMAARDWTTLQLIHQVASNEFAARNPFPVGGVVEDPATGAAAAALGGYLRELELVEPPAVVVVRQGEDMGRPSELVVEIPSEGGIAVTGTAVRI